MNVKLFLKERGEDVFYGVIFGSLLLFILLFTNIWITAAIATILCLMGIRIVPTVEFAVVTHWMRRTGRILTEGFNWVWPIITTTRRFSEQLDPDTVTVSFNTSDRVEIFNEGSLQWRADRTVTYERKAKVLWWERTMQWLTFIDNSEEAILRGIVDAIKSTLGTVAGLHTVDDFIKNRQALEDLINAILRLEHLPHLEPNMVGALRVPPVSTGLTYVDPASGIVPPGRLLAFYRKYAKELKRLLEDERNDKQQKSLIERRYGIHIETFALAQVKFDKKTQEAFERERQAQAEAAAAEKKLTLVVEGSQKIGAAHPTLSPETKVNVAAASVGVSPRQTIAFEGTTGGTLPTVIPIPILQPPPPTTGGT